MSPCGACVSFNYMGTEALSVVSEDQSIFDPPYLMKTEVPPAEDYNSKERPALGEPDWSSQTSRGQSVKRENENVNCSRSGGCRD
uniref:Uncharacterized protein n=1 Tax=Chelonoidis abingdonii TaxID=106734 RepID=A0A8C0HB86_CHEAB